MSRRRLREQRCNKHKTEGGSANQPPHEQLGNSCPSGKNIGSKQSQKYIFFKEKRQQHTGNDMEPRFFSGVCVPFFPLFFGEPYSPSSNSLRHPFPTSFTCCAAESWEEGRRKKKEKKKEKEKKGPWSTWQIASLNRGVNHRGAHTLTQWRGLIHNTTHTHKKRERNHRRRHRRRSQ